MMGKKKLTLDQPVTYQIKVPGILDEKWLDWNGGLTVKVENERDDGIGEEKEADRCGDRKKNHEPEPAR